MSTHSSLGRRVVAVLGAAAVGLIGLVGAANAAETTPGPGNIDPAHQATLTIHKYDGTPGKAGDGTVQDATSFGNALAGVQFTITPVTAKGRDTISLDTAAGWDLINGVTAAGVQAGGYTLDTASAKTVTTDASGATPTTGLGHGLYLVTETGYGDNSITTPVVPFLVTLPLPQTNGGWLYDVHVYPKNTVDKNVPSKTVSDPSAVTIGSTVPWTINAPVQPNKPGVIAKFTITDQLDSRLTYKDLSIAGFTAVTDYNVTDVNGLVTIEFTATGVAKLKAGDMVVVTLNTKVTSVGDGVIPNEATVYTNDNGGKSTTNPGNPEPSTNWGTLEISKVAQGDSAKALAGAVFAVYDGDNQVGTITTDATGHGSIDLWVGNDSVNSKDYTFKETTAPAGYVLDATVHTVSVKAGASTVTGIQTVTNTQQTHPTLPLTGANGQLLMTVGGLALVLLAGGGALVVRSKRHQN